MATRANLLIGEANEEFVRPTRVNQEGIINKVEPGAESVYNFDGGEARLIASHHGEQGAL